MEYNINKTCEVVIKNQQGNPIAIFPNAEIIRHSTNNGVTINVQLQEDIFKVFQREPLFTKGDKFIFRKVGIDKQIMGQLIERILLYNTIGVITEVMYDKDIENYQYKVEFKYGIEYLYSEDYLKELERVN